MFDPRPFPAATALFGVAALATVSLASPLTGQDAPLADRIEIILENDTERERDTAAQLREVLAEHEVERWTWTERIRIAAGEIPHSHPVLTLHTRALGNPIQQLATYLHEQFHWFVAANPEAEAAAIAAFRERFPEVPAGGREGARDEYSTYLHLIVCDLEFQAMTARVGEAAARELLDSSNHYTWIYETVLTDSTVRDINREYGFDVAVIDAGERR
jgi:hypothetical protein